MMFRRLRTRPARWAAGAAATVALAGAGLAAVASPAYAEQFPFTDDFEGTPANRWVVDTVPGQTAVGLGTVTGAHSGSKAATLDAGAVPASTIARIYRTVTPDPVSPRPLQRCTLSIYTKRIPSQNPVYSPPVAHLYAKIRSGDSFGKVTLAGAKVISSTGWQQWAVGSFFYPAGTFTIDLHIYFAVVMIDDLAITCRNLI